MFVDFLLDMFRHYPEREAIIWQNEGYSYERLLQTVNAWLNHPEMQAIVPGAIVALEADFSPSAIALLLTLIERGCIVVPLTESVAAKKAEFRQVAEVERIITITPDDKVTFEVVTRHVQNELLLTLKGQGRPGLILFSSGSTGKSKAALHDFVPLLEKFKQLRNSQRMFTFLLFDHIGGINTLLHALSNAGTVITVQDRSPDAVCAAIERHRVEVLPTSPTFINLLLLSGAYQRHDLSSLQLVTYGTETMPESTLKRFYKLFPGVRLQQTYGLSEVGILRAKSKASDSLWVKIGGQGYETRVVDGLLEIRAKSAMLGYLNAPSPFTEDGWFKTGDAVEVDGEYIHILGRKSEMINVGGQKVYPAEVEGVLQSMDGVEDATVCGEPSPITGRLVTARMKLGTSESLGEFRQRMRAYCKDKLDNYKIPQKVVLVDSAMYGERFKKIRREG
jgi:acyl-coenzyme A synthetase/AMP-(fatty) acid ligase